MPSLEVGGVHMTSWYCDIEILEKIKNKKSINYLTMFLFRFLPSESHCRGVIREGSV